MVIALVLTALFLVMVFYSKKIKNETLRDIIIQFSWSYTLVGNIFMYFLILPTYHISERQEMFKPEIHKFSNRLILVDSKGKNERTYRDIKTYNTISDSTMAYRCYYTNCYDIECYDYITINK
jgi:hypothetical protein